MTCGKVALADGEIPMGSSEIVLAAGAVATTDGSNVFIGGKVYLCIDEAA